MQSEREREREREREMYIYIYTYTDTLRIQYPAVFRKIKHISNPSCGLAGLGMVLASFCVGLSGILKSTATSPSALTLHWASGEEKRTSRDSTGSFILRSAPIVSVLILPSLLLRFLGNQIGLRRPCGSWIRGFGFAI